MKQKYIRALLPPLVMLLIFSIFYTVCGIAPFSTKSIAWCDMEQQVIPLMLDLCSPGKTVSSTPPAMRGG